MIIRKRKWDYKGNKEIVDSLSEKEQYYVAPRGYKKVSSDMLFYYYTEYYKGIPIAFIDVYRKDEHTGFILLAVRKEYQGNGLSKYLLYKAITDCKRIRNLYKLIYVFDNDNIKSCNLVKRMPGFKFIDKDDRETYYEYNLRE